MGVLKGALGTNGLKKALLLFWFTAHTITNNCIFDSITCLSSLKLVYTLMKLTFKTYRQRF